MRRRAPRVLAGVFAFGWIVLPGFGAIDLTVTWSRDWPQVLEAGWGLFFTVFVGVPFVLVAVRPHASRQGAAQLAVAAAALAVSAPLAREPGVLVLAAAVAVETAVVVALVTPEWRRGRGGPAWPLLALAGVGVVPWLAYALDMWELNRESLPDADITNGIDHYAVQGAVGLVLALLPALAALRADVRPLAPACSGAVAAYLGLVSYAWPDAAGGFDRGWSAAAMAWGLLLIGTSSLDFLRERLTRRAPR